MTLQFKKLHPDAKLPARGSEHAGCRMNLAVIEIPYPRKRQRFDAKPAECLECPELAQFTCIDDDGHSYRCWEHAESWATERGLKLRVRERAA